MLKKLLLASLTAIAFTFLPIFLRAQDGLTWDQKLLAFPDKLFHSIDKKTSDLYNGLDRASLKYLHKLHRSEQKLKRKLARTDSAAAARIFGGSDDLYAQLENRLYDSTFMHPLQSDYNGHLDSLKTTLDFLDHNNVLSKTSNQLKQLNAVRTHFSQLQNKMNQTTAIQQLIAKRKAELHQQLEGLGLTKQLNVYKQQAYYYRAQVEQYKNVFADPEKLEKKLLQIAMKIPAFASFFRQHSILGQMFRLPGGDDLPLTALQGLQTRAQIIQEMQNNFGSVQNLSRSMNTGLQDAQTQMNDLQNRRQRGTADADMPNFKPNNEKTKSFLKRLELGTNVQNARSNSFIPTTTDIGLSVGYKLNSKSIAGIGTSYKVGWGRDIRHIALTHEGAGVRSFLDLRLKGNFWITGGGELNYHSSFKNFEQLKNYSAWQKSALAGISKKYQLKEKLKGSIQLMYDFLSSKQVPRAQPVVFRLGYNFK